MRYAEFSAYLEWYFGTWSRDQQYKWKCTMQFGNYKRLLCFHYRQCEQERNKPSFMCGISFLIRAYSRNHSANRTFFTVIKVRGIVPLPSPYPSSSLSFPPVHTPFHPLPNPYVTAQAKYVEHVNIEYSIISISYLNLKFALFQFQH